MYPQGELKTLAWNKARLRRRIAREREECAEAATCLVQPLAWFDRVRAQWSWLSPLLKIASVPLGFIAKRSSAAPVRLFGAVLRWAPVVMSVVRGFKSTRTERS